MKIEDIQFNSPVQMVDGKFGIIINIGDIVIGIQVHGEEDIRYRLPDQLQDLGGGVLREYFDMMPLPADRTAVVLPQPACPAKRLPKH